MNDLAFATDLGDLAASALHRTVEQVVDQALASLERLAPYDLAAVLERSGSHLIVRYARGPLSTDQVRHHVVDLATRPRLRAALDEGRAMAVTESIHASEGDPYEGVLDLPDGHSCMVVPLVADGRPLGAITLDRSVCAPYPASVVKLVGAYADLLALVIACAEKSDLLERYQQQLEERNRQLVATRDTTDATRLLANSHTPAMADLIGQARLVAPTTSPVLITGETGTGKEVLARAIHDWSPRAERAFVALNCAAIPEDLVESELFGHIRGAFSGADRDRAGRFSTANGGTLLLDEIGDLPLAAQGKLLRVLQEGTISPVGSDRSVRVDVRVLAATHVDLRDAIAEKRFREDLYYRLGVFPLALPALRDRRPDILPIARRLLERLERSGQGPWTLHPDAATWLESQRWDGNIRQLANTLERATILRPSGEISVDLFGESHSPTVPSEVTWSPGPLDSVIRGHIEHTLAHTGGKIYGTDGAAVLLGLAPSTLQNRMHRLGIDHTRFRDR